VHEVAAEIRKKLQNDQGEGVCAPLLLLAISNSSAARDSRVVSEAARIGALAWAHLHACVRTARHELRTHGCKSQTLELTSRLFADDKRSRERSPRQDRNVSGEASPYRKNNGSDAVEPRGRQVIIKRSGVGASPASGHVGIGVKFRDDQGQHIVTSLLPDGPADKTKQVFQGDKMIAVDGVPLYGKSSSEVIDLILGPPGADLTLTLQRSDHYSGENSPSPGSTSITQQKARDETPDLKSLDSPSAEEFELVSPEQRRESGALSQRRESGALSGVSPRARDYSVGVKFAMDDRMRITVHLVVPGTVRVS